jgi:hypothetical protein
MTEYLNQTDLHTLTGYARPLKQMAWLTAHGIPHKVDGARVIVSHRHVTGWLEGRTVASGIFNRSLIK